MYPFIERCIKLGQTGTCLILARYMGKTVFSGWLLWMHTASLGSFYLAKQECLCGSSPLSVTACHFYPKPSLLSTPIPWPSVSSRFTVGQQNHLAAKYDLYFGVPAEQVFQALELGICLGMWAPRFCGAQTSVLQPPDPSVQCMSAWIGDDKKPKGLTTNKETLLPLCRSQLASHRDNFSCSIVTKAGFGWISFATAVLGACHRLGHHRERGKRKESTGNPMLGPLSFVSDDAERDKTAHLMKF